MQHRNHDFNFKVKAVGDAGTFTGLAAVYNNVDLGGDKILPGAFTRTLTPPGKQFVLLWQHDTTSPIGSCTLTDTREGLKVDGTLLLTDPVAMRAYNLIKAGVIKGLSIGYETIQENRDGDVRELVEIKLWEISIVTFAMNQSASVAGVKSMSKDEIAGHLQNIDTHRKAIDKHQRAIRLSLKALLGDDLDDDLEADLPADDPGLMEGNDDQDDPEDEGMSMSKAVSLELQKMIEQVRELTTA